MEPVIINLSWSLMRILSFLPEKQDDFFLRDVRECVYVRLHMRNFTDSYFLMPVTKVASKQDDLSLLS